MPRNTTKSTAEILLKILEYTLGTAVVAALGLLLNLLAGNPGFAHWIYSNPNCQRDLEVSILACSVAAISIEVWRHFSSRAPKREPPPPEDLTAYRQFIIDYKCNALELAVMHSSAHELDRKILLWSIFVPQSACESAPIPEMPPEIQRQLREEGHLSKLLDEDELAEYRERYYSSPVRPIFEILDRNRQVVIVGDPGSGKTSLIKHRALQWAKEDLGPLPLLVELSSYARDEDRKGILEYFLCGLDVPHLDAAHLQRRLQTGQAAFYLDGLDEIFDRPTRKSVIDEIVMLCATYSQARIVVTTRKVGYEPECLRNAGFLHATLEEFNDRQISEFLDRWHLTAVDDFALRPRLRKRIANAIAESRAIRELAGNPLLLTMMAILNRNQDLPRDRVKLYELASQILLHEWDWTRALLPANHERIARQEKERLLRILAGKMQQTEGGVAGNLIRRDRLVSIFRAYLEEIGFAEPYSISIALVQQLTERNFILAYTGADRFCFVHRTFLEYFCAAWFVERMGFMEGSAEYLCFAQLRDEVFGKHWKDESWHEVLRLIVGTVHETKAGEIIRFLMAQDGRNNKLANLMLAAGCLTEVRNRGLIQSAAQALWLQLKERAIRFDPPKAYEIYDYFEEAGPTRQAAVRWMARAWKDGDSLAWLRSAATQNWDWIVRQAVVRELARGWHDDPATLPFLLDCAHKDQSGDVRGAALQELAHGWSDDPSILPLLHDFARNDEDHGTRQVAIQELIRGWHDDPPTLTLLHDRARHDEWHDVRKVAIQELARRWREDPSTLTLLHSLARNDESEKVRKASLQELVQGWKDDRQTIVLLNDRIREDKHPDVRRAAVEQLARSWKNDPDMLAWIQDHALNDEDEYIRAAAVEELAHGWGDDPATLPLLQDRARNDKGKSVRKAVVTELSLGWRDDPFTLTWVRHTAQVDEDPIVRQEAVRALSFEWRGDSGTLPLIQERARNDEDAAVRRTALLRLAYAWKDDSGTLPLVQDRTRNDEHFDVRRKAARALARYWKDARCTLPLLQDRAHRDECELVRAWALEELARGWHDDPATLPLLKDRASNDEDSMVRHASVEELAHGWKEDPATLTWLHGRVRSDRHYDVRETAVRELVRGWRDDPATLPLISDRARNDEHYHVRETAVRELAHGWRDDPETLCFLHDRARDDESENVRKEAIRMLVRGWKRDPQTITLLNERIYNDKHADVRQAAIEHLARGWMSDPGTLPLLQDLICDDDGDVRRAAVEQLARNWENDPRMRSWLHDHARHDPKAFVRREAVILLIRTWKDDPGTRPLLEDLARNDVDKSVRREAVENLAGSWKDDPNTLPLLRHSLANDVDWLVRSEAMRQLATILGENSNALPMAQDQASLDEGGAFNPQPADQLAFGWRNDKK